MVMTFGTSALPAGRFSVCSLTQPQMRRAAGDVAVVSAGPGGSETGVLRSCLPAHRETMVLGGDLKVRLNVNNSLMENLVL